MSAVWSWLHKKRADKVLRALGEEYGAENVKRLSPLMKAILDGQMAQGLLPADTEWTFDHGVVERLFLQAQKEETDESRTAGADFHGGAGPMAAAGAGLRALPFGLGAGAFGPGTIIPVTGMAASQSLLNQAVLRQQGLAIVAPEFAAERVPPEPDPEFLSEVVIGRRVWRRLETAGGINLQSLSVSTCWPPRTPLQADCPVDGPLVPGWGCACGLYAWRLDRRWQDLPLQITGLGVSDVVGLVGLWGRVIQHHDGWRGQYGYPLAFFAPPVPPGFPTGSAFETLAKRYAVPLISEARDRWPAWLRRVPL